MVNNINIPNKQSGDQFTADEFNLLLNGVNSAITEFNTNLESGATNDTGATIKAKLEELEDDARLDASAVKNLPELPPSGNVTTMVAGEDLGQQSFVQFGSESTIEAIGLKLRSTIGPLASHVVGGESNITILDCKFGGFEFSNFVVAYNFASKTYLIAGSIDSDNTVTWGDPLLVVTDMLAQGKLTSYEYGASDCYAFAYLDMGLKLVWVTADGLVLSASNVLLVDNNPHGIEYISLCYEYSSSAIVQMVYSSFNSGKRNIYGRYSLSGNTIIVDYEGLIFDEATNISSVALATTRDKQILISLTITTGMVLLYCEFYEGALVVVNQHTVGDSYSASYEPILLINNDNYALIYFDSQSRAVYLPFSLNGDELALGAKNYLSQTPIYHKLSAAMSNDDGKVLLVGLGVFPQFDGLSTYFYSGNLANNLKLTAYSTNSQSLLKLPYDNSRYLFVFSYYVDGNYCICTNIVTNPTPNLDAQRLIGVANDQGLAGDAISVSLLGGIVSGFASLTIGAFYYLHSDGSLSTDDGSGVFIGRAISSTEIETVKTFIEDDAEVNVNADWNSTSGDSQILNKPALGTAASINYWTGTQAEYDANTIKNGVAAQSAHIATIIG